MKVYQAFLAYCWHVLGNDLTLCLPYTCMVVTVMLSQFHPAAWWRLHWQGAPSLPAKPCWEAAKKIVTLFILVIYTSPFSLFQSPSDQKSVLCRVYIFKSCHAACPQVLLVMFMSSSNVTRHVCTSSSDLSCLIDVHRQVSLMFARIHIKCYLSYLHVCHQMFVCHNTKNTLCTSF